MTGETTTRDLWYGGSLWLTQPATGFRATGDAIMLAAAVPEQCQQVLELGVGAGAAMMIMAKRMLNTRFTGIDHDQAMLDLCSINAVDNGFSDRITLIHADISVASLEQNWDHVVMNPPFNDPSSSMSPAAQRRQSMAADFALPWVACASSALVKKGGLTMIARADQLDRVLLALSTHDFGELVVRPVYSRPQKPANRVLIRARKGMAGAMTLLPSLMMESDEYHALGFGGNISLMQPGRKYAPVTVKP